MSEVSVSLEESSWTIMRQMGAELGIDDPEELVMCGLDFLRVLVDSRSPDGYVSIKRNDGRLYEFKLGK